VTIFLLVHDQYMIPDEDSMFTSHNYSMIRQEVNTSNGNVTIKVYGYMYVVLTGYGPTFICDQVCKRALIQLNLIWKIALYSITCSYQMIELCWYSFLTK